MTSLFTSIFRSRLCSLVLGIALLLSRFVPSAFAEDPSLLEYRVKAVCLYNFAKYIKWPENAFATPQSPLKLCILGKNPFGNLFDNATGKVAQDRTLEISLMESVKTSEELTSCQIVFWTASDAQKFAPLIGTVKDLPILTVSEVEDGGIVNFFIQDSKVRFSINLYQAKRAALNISSQLLKLAKVVDQDKES